MCWMTANPQVQQLERNGKRHERLRSWTPCHEAGIPSRTLLRTASGARSRLLEAGEMGEVEALRHDAGRLTWGLDKSLQTKPSDSFARPASGRQKYLPTSLPRCPAFPSRPHPRQQHQPGEQEYDIRNPGCHRRIDHPPGADCFGDLDKQEEDHRGTQADRYAHGGSRSG